MKTQIIGVTCIAAILLGAGGASAITNIPPAAGYGIGICAGSHCQSTTLSSTTQVQTQTCGGSGNIIVVYGNQNDVDVCSQDQDQNSTALS